MQLETLVRQLQTVDPGVSLLNPRALEIRGLADDSREVRESFLFAAIPGNKADGNAYVADALARGATALLVERAVSEPVPQIVSPDVRQTLALAASLFFGEPSRRMTVLAVTGTNGKTTTAFLLREVLQRCGVSCGLVGTVSNIVGGETRVAKLTTPGAIQIQQMLAEMLAQGDRACAMEVSSHALDQHRAASVDFSGAIFTNLTRDHLDYHKDFETYFAAKAKLFAGLRPGVPAVFNLDAGYGQRMMAVCTGRALGFSLERDADVRIESVSLSVSGVSFALHRQGQVEMFASPMTGRYNVQNLAGVIALALELGLPLENVREAMADFRGAPGRLERVMFEGEGPTVFIDYAHSPDAMENVLATLRQVCAGRTLTVVFGCGGDRDRTKRARMGAIAAQLADRPIVTSDNPRSEDPAAIIDEILAGVQPRRPPVETCIDRRQAIDTAVASAGPGEVIAILGKGHEDYQIFSDRTVHFDDKEEARGALQRHWGAGSRRTVEV